MSVVSIRSKNLSAPAVFKILYSFVVNSPMLSVIAGVGQLTSFNQLGFKGVKDRPDGWYLPKDTGLPAIILEVKGSNIPLKA